MRNIARFTGASVTGITINQYQVKKKKKKKKNRCRYMRM